MSNGLHTVTESEYEGFIAEGTRIVFVVADWAGGAKTRQIAEKLQRRLSGLAKVGIIDADADYKLAELLTKAVPSMHAFKNGQQVCTVVGMAERDQLLSRLQAAGVGVAGSVSQVEAAPEEHLMVLKDFIARIRTLPAVGREDLAAALRNWSAAAQQGAPLEPYIDASYKALGQLPSLVRELEDAVRTLDTHVVSRLGILSALLYGAAPEDGLNDNLPGGYGYLDDWLVLNSARWLYLRQPDPVEVQSLSKFCQLVWLSLPPTVIAPVYQLVERMTAERVAMQQVPAADLEALFVDAITRPAPTRFIVPPVQQGPAAASTGGWSQTAGGGAMWGDGTGASYHRFDGGGSIGMTSSGKIVGLG